MSTTAGLHNHTEANEDILGEPVHKFGVDSLQALELLSWFAKEFAADVPIFEILGESTLMSVGLCAATKSKLRWSVAT